MSGFGDHLSTLLNHTATATAVGVANRIGLLDHLTDAPQTAAELAKLADLHLRYVEETLAVLVCGGVVEIAKGQVPSAYFLSPDRKVVLAGMALYFEEIPILTVCAFDQIGECARKKTGIDSECYSPFHKWMGKLADEKHEKTLIQKLLPAIPAPAGSGAGQSAGQTSIVDLLRAPCQNKKRVLDLGCGEGTAALLIAQEFPNVEVVGVDITVASVEAATSKAAARGLTNVEFVVGDAAALPAEWSGSEESGFDLIIAFDVIHDLPLPEATLIELQRVLKKTGGTFAMIDIRAETEVVQNLQHSMAPFLYAVSLMHCMPQGLGADGCGPGLGMMWGRTKAKAMLQEAGFSTTEIVEMDFDTFNDLYVCTV